jgi:hypothetical protein
VPISIDKKGEVDIYIDITIGIAPSIDDIAKRLTKATILSTTSIFEVFR